MPRVLACQSHVVHGYVGNKAATFPLQCVGWDVDCVNSVQFSNHTGYGMDKVSGSKTNAHQLTQVFEGVMRLKDDYDALLSGYMPNRNTLACMARFYKEIKRHNRNLLWLLDPVMGDEGQLYVDEDVIPEYQDIIHSGLVDIITPNQFEMELLYGKPIVNISDLYTAIQEIHQFVPVIVITSCSASLFDDPTHIYSVSSMRGSPQPYVYRVSVIESYFTGVGDMFSAMLLHQLYYMFESKNISLFHEKTNVVLNVIHRVLEITKRLSANVKGSIGDPVTMREMELRVIESIDCYECNSIDKDFSFKYDWTSCS
ncbi:Bud16 [Kluyveromyces lactis]|nr:Bud16 [Kluyveromyces lactis]